jgi:peptidoglycan/LPS O-acetylase OafA/YrhL
MSALARGAQGRHPGTVASAADERRRTHFAELEAYRGVAALLVLVFHAYQYSREGTGTPDEVYAGTPLHALFHNLEAPVAWFFALSGFLLFLPFARAAIEQRELPSSRGFLIRRAIRIVPPYYLACLLVWCWRFTGGVDQWRDLEQHLTFTQIFNREQIFWTIGPAWSLAVEVQFYLLLAILGPCAYAFCGRFADQRARTLALVAGVGAVLLASVAYKGWAGAVAQIPREDFPIYFGLFAKLDTFALGMLLAIAVQFPRVRCGAGVSTLLRGAGIGLLVGVFAFRGSSAVIDLYFHTFAAVAFLLVLMSTTLGPRESRWARALAHPAFQILGTISYSIYLWHEPLLIELGQRNLLIRTTPDAFPVNALVLVVLAVAVAALSYYGVERPLGELRWLFTRKGQLAERYPALASRRSRG